MSKSAEPAEHLPPEVQQALFSRILQLGDDLLILGHRLSEWCGHGPLLEEDIALANLALDCLGQAEYWLGLSGSIENLGRSADDLAFFREATEFRNAILLEQPNADFARTMLRHLLYSRFLALQLSAFESSSFLPLAAYATKSLKEVQYHLRHAETWCIRLGAGTSESAARMASALDYLWPLTSELFQSSADDQLLATSGLCANPSSFEAPWREALLPVFRAAELNLPASADPLLYSGRSGRHSEHLGHLLAEMQSTARAFPGVAW